MMKRNTNYITNGKYVPYHLNKVISIHTVRYLEGEFKMVFFFIIDK